MDISFKTFKQALLLGSSLLLLNTSILADPPFITDDAELVKYKHWEVFLYFFYNNSKNATSFTAPSLEVDYGLLPNLEVDATFTLLGVFPRREFGANAVGFSDIDLQAKYQIVKETDCIPKVTFVPFIAIPTGDVDRNLGNGRIWYQIPIAVEKTWGKWTTYASVGYAFNSAPGNQNFAFGGWVLEKEMNDTWTLGVEMYGQQKSSDIYGAYVLVNFGGYYKLSKNLDLIFNAGNNFIGQRNFIAGIGLDWSN